MKITDKNFRQFSSDRSSLRNLSDEIDKALGLDKARNHDLQSHLDHIGSSETIPDSVSYNPNPGRGENEITLSRELGSGKREIESHLRSKERLEQRIAKATDKNELKALNDDLKELNKKLEDVGKEGQRHAGRAIEDYNEHLSSVMKDQNAAIEALENHQDDITNALRKIEHGKTLPPGALDKLGDTAIEVELRGGKKFNISKAGIVDSAGTAVDLTKIDKAEFKEIVSKAENVAEEHIGKTISKVQQAGEQYEGVIKRKVEALESHQEFLAEKTKIGKAVEGKVPTKTSVGTKLATEKGIIGEAAYEKLGMTSKFGADIKANWKSGGLGKLKVGAGALVVADGARRAFQGISGMISSDPEKQEQAGFGTLVVGAGEIIGGGLLARMGGKNVAIGM